MPVFKCFMLRPTALGAADTIPMDPAIELSENALPGENLQLHGVSSRESVSQLLERSVPRVEFIYAGAWK